MNWTAVINSIEPHNTSIRIAVAFNNGIDTVNEDFVASDSTHDFAWLQNQVNAKMIDLTNIYAFKSQLSKGMIISGI